MLIEINTSAQYFISQVHIMYKQQFIWILHKINLTQICISDSDYDWKREKSQTSGLCLWSALAIPLSVFTKAVPGLCAGSFVFALLSIDQIHLLW